MSCPAYKDRVDAYADGQLSGGERRELEAHLASCPACAREARALARLARTLDALPAFEPSAAFSAGFRERLRAVAPRRPGLAERLFGGWRGWAAAAVGVAAAAAIAVALWPRDERSPVAPGGGAGGPQVVAKGPPAGLLRNLEMLREMETVRHLDVLEGMTAEEFEAVSRMKELGG